MFSSSIFRRLAAVVAGASTVLTLAAAVPASAGPRTAAPQRLQGGAEQVELPGLRDSSYDLTLITGDHITLTRTGTRYTVIADPAPRSDGRLPAVNVDVRTDHGKAISVRAVPDDAQAAVASGVVDAGLFDVLHLAKQVRNGTQSDLPVTVRYDGQVDVAQMRQRAADLPGSTVVTSNAAAGTVNLQIDPHQSADFWAAVKGDTGIGELNRYLLDGVQPKLRGGISSVWTTGHRAGPSAVQPQSDTKQPLQQVTLTITKHQGDAVYCPDKTFTLCLMTFPALVRLDGSSAGTAYEAIAGRCVDEDPCATIELDFAMPKGRYYLGGTGRFWLDGWEQMLDLTIPEVVVSGDTEIAFDGDQTQRVSVRTPRPSEVYIGSTANFRTYANGQGGASLLFTSWGNSNYWERPSRPVETGTFHLTQNWLLGKPMVTMSVKQPTSFKLDAMLPTFWYKRPGFEVTRFGGQHRYQLVDAGLGRAEDYAGRSVRGKLVLLKLDADETGRQCAMKSAQLARALDAGAAGVIADPTAVGGPWPVTVCWGLITPGGWDFNEDVPDLPYASIPLGQAQRLRALLAKGKVTIDVSGEDRVSSYVYMLHNYQEGRIPSSLQTTLINRDLVAEDVRLQASEAGPAELDYSAFRPNESFVGGVPYVGLQQPAGFTAYKGPVAADVVRNEWLMTDSGSNFTQGVLADTGTRVQSWGVQPAMPGLPTQRADIFAAQPGKWVGYGAMSFCVMCRQGNTFYPLVYKISGASPTIADDVHAFTPDNLHLYADGKELAQGYSLMWGPTYQLAPAKSPYRLVTKTLDGKTRTTWWFNSAAATKDQVAPGFRCPEGVGTMCRGESLTFLRYNAHTNLRNTVAANGWRKLEVVAYTQGRRTPAVQKLKLELSTDSGKHWQRVQATPQGKGVYSVRYHLPRLERTSGTVSIRAVAKDRSGYGIRQIALDAFRIRR